MADTETGCVEGVSDNAVESVDITPKQDGGIMKEVLTAGSGGSPTANDTVSVHYVGTLAADGSQFDSSRTTGEWFEFKLGAGSVIKGWDIGVATMQKDELSRFTIKSDYAYGDSGSPPKIPGGATLVFEIELFQWKGEDLTPEGDGGIIRSLIRKGEGSATPNDGAWVMVHLTGKCGKTTYDDRTVEFNVGEGIEKNIPNGVEIALLRFKKGEKSLLTLKPNYGFGSSGNSELGVAADTAVEYTVELKDFEKVKETWEMDQEEKIDQAKVYKEKGTNYFKASNYGLAAKQYLKITDLLSYDSGLDDEKKEENHALKLAGDLNLAMCYLKLEDYTSAKSHASTAIEQDPASVKGYFRRGQALQNLEDLDAAVADYKKCLELDSTNGAAKKQLVVCGDLIKKHKQREKQIYSGMFEKFAKADQCRTAAARRGGVLKDGVGEWDDKSKEEKDGDLSDVKLLSSGEEIKADEFMSTS